MDASDERGVTGLQASTYSGNLPPSSTLMTILALTEVRDAATEVYVPQCEGHLSLTLEVKTAPAHPWLYEVLQ